MSRPAKQDWHPADVGAALKKRGWSFSRIAREYGYTNICTPRTVVKRPYAVMEKIVADIVGVRPQDIWPSRYDSGGVSLQPRARRRPQGAASGGWAVRKQRAASQNCQ